MYLIFKLKKKKGIFMIEKSIKKITVSAILIVGIVGCESADELKKISTNIQSINQNLESD